MSNNNASTGFSHEKVETNNFLMIVLIVLVHVVMVILADFRGLDTMVEITVLAVAVVGVASLLRGGRSW